MNLGIRKDIIDFTEDFRYMPNKLLQKLNFLKDVITLKNLRYGCRSSIYSRLELLNRDNCPYETILESKGIIEKKTHHMNV